MVDETWKNRTRYFVRNMDNLDTIVKTRSCDRIEYDIHVASPLLTRHASYQQLQIFPISRNDSIRDSRGSITQKKG